MLQRLRLNLALTLCIIDAAPLIQQLALYSGFLATLAMLYFAHAFYVMQAGYLPVISLCGFLFCLALTVSAFRDILDGYRDELLARLER